MQMHKRVIRKIARMSATQRLRTLERAGIYTKNGQLTEQYGGPKRRRRSKSRA